MFDAVVFAGAPSLGAAIGIGAYQLEKPIFHSVHPRFGAALGF